MANTGFAVYDKTIGQYVSGVYDTEGKAKAAAKAPEGHKTEIRKV